MSSKIVRMQRRFGWGGSGGWLRTRPAMPSAPILSVLSTALALVGAIIILAFFLSPQYKIQRPNSPGPDSRPVLAAPLSTNSSGSVYYRETGHYLRDAFLNYWLMN